MVASTLNTVISGVCTIGVAAIGYHQLRNQKKQDACEELRSEGTLLQMEMTEAAMNLSETAAKAIATQRVNGELDSALRRAHEVRMKYEDFMRRSTQML